MATSDVFAFGAVLYFAAVGRPLFTAEYPAALMDAIAHQEPDLTAVADPSLRALVADCLAKDLASRVTPADVLARCGVLLGRQRLAHEPVWSLPGFPVAPAVVRAPEGPATDERTRRGGQFEGVAPLAVEPGAQPAASPFLPARV
jgi:serine/threonine protein kinase